MRPPRPPRRGRNTSRRSRVRRARFNPDEAPPLSALDLSGPDELVRTRKSRKEQKAPTAQAPMPFNPGEDKCLVKKVAAVIIPVNASLVAWCRAEASRVQKSKLPADKLGRLLVLASAVGALPIYSPDAWETKGVPHVKLTGRSREVFVPACAGQVDANTPIYLVQVSSPSAPVGSLLGSIGGADLTHHSGLVRFVLEHALGPDAYGVQVLLPEDYLADAPQGEEPRPTFHSAQFFELLREYVLDAVAGADFATSDTSSPLRRTREARRSSAGAAALKAARKVKEATYKVASRGALGSGAQVARNQAHLLSTCLLRLGAPLAPACYFPQHWSSAKMPVVPAVMQRAIQNLMSRVLMSIEPLPRDKMLSRVQSEARNVRSLEDFEKWVKAQGVSDEVAARLLFPHTLVRLGVSFEGAAVTFTLAKGKSFTASSTDEVASALSGVPGVSHTSTDAIWIGWSGDPDKILVTPQVPGVPPAAVAAGIVTVPDRRGELLAGAEQGKFSASSRTRLASEVSEGATRLVIFGDDGAQSIWAVTCTGTDSRGSDFTAVRVPATYQVVLKTVLSGLGEAAEIFGAFEFDKSVELAEGYDLKTYGKHLNTVAGRLSYVPKPPRLFSFRSGRDEARGLAGPVLRLEAFPDPQASNEEIKAGLVPMVSTIKQFKTLKSAISADRVSDAARSHLLARAKDLQVNLMQKPSAGIEPLVLFAVPLKKPLRGAPRGITLGKEHDPRTLYFLTSKSVAPSEKGGRTMMDVLPWTDHHRSLLHKGFMAGVEFPVSGRIEFKPLGDATFDGQPIVTPLFDPNSYRRNKRVLSIYEGLKARAEAKSNPEVQAGAEGGFKIGAARSAGIPEYQVGKPASSQEEERLFREAVIVYLSRIFSDLAPSAELRARKSRAALADAAIRQATRTHGGGYGAKASQSASRWAVAARTRQKPPGWEPNLLGVMDESGLLYGPDEMDITPPASGSGSGAWDGNLLQAAMIAYGIHISPNAAGRVGRAEQVKALKRLRAAVEKSPLQTFERESLEYVPAPRIRAHLSASEGYGLEEAPEDEIIARLNPADPYAEYLAQELAGEGVGGEVPEAALDYRATRAAFPTRYARKEQASPALHAERIASQGKFVQFARRRGVDDFNLSDYQSKLEGQAGFSVPEARAVISRLSDAYGRRFKTTIPASSAACAVNRTKKLKGYRFPRVIMEAGLPGFARKKVVIWVSPQADAGDARVMVYRRNSRLDCDLKVSPTRSLGQAMALALQDTLLWLAQKEGRQRDTFVYVGRVGNPTLNLAWKPGDALAFPEMLRNLDNDAGSITVEMDSARDINNYQQAALGVAGPVMETIREKVATARPAQAAPEETVEVVRETSVPEGAGFAQDDEMPDTDSMDWLHAPPQD